MGEKNHWSHFSWTDFDWIRLLIQLILKPSQTPLCPRCRVPQSVCTLIPPLSLFPFGPPLCLPSAFPFSSSLRRGEKLLHLPPVLCPRPPHIKLPLSHWWRGKDTNSKASFSVFDLQRFGTIALLETSDCWSRTWLQVIVIFQLLETSSSQRFSGLSAQYTLSDHPWDCFLLSPASLWGCSIFMLIRSWCSVSVAVNAFVRLVLYAHIHIYTHQQIKNGSGKTPFSSESHIKQCLN